tara:strand:+ start:174 stop:341 length:168 start_codon:yes stop_codon:yes gene_type:complete
MQISKSLFKGSFTLTEEHVCEDSFLIAFLIGFSLAFIISIKGNYLFMSLVKGASL